MTGRLEDLFGRGDRRQGLLSLLHRLRGQVVGLQAEIISPAEGATEALERLAGFPEVLLSEASSTKRSLRYRTTGKRLHFAYDPVHEGYLLAGALAVTGETEATACADRIGSVLHVLVEGLDAERVTRDLEKRCRQLEAELRVRELQHKDDLQSHFEAAEELRKKDRDYARSLELEVSRRTQDLARANAELEKALQIKGEFLANVSHEIRTPMNAILGLSELVLGSALAEEQREYVEHVHGSAEALLVIINDLLDLSKIEAGKLQLEAGIFDLRGVTDDVMRVLGPRAREKGIELSWHVDSRVPALLVGDSGRLRQILLNLVGNAVKFTGKGGIIVESELAEQLEDRVILHLRITDTGIGIPRDRQEAIFEAFTQVDGSTTRQFGGTGLGLTICSQLVAAMGGKIWVESEQGSGSTFHFTARFGIGAAPSNRVDSRSPLAGKTLLVVDPEEETRRLLREMLAAQGALALPAEGVSEAVAVACQRASLDSGLDAVLISDHTCSTPEELVAEIRLILGCAEIPALLLQTEDEGEVPSIFSGAVSRPVVESELAERLRELLEASPRKAPWGDCKAPLDILLAEDNLVNRKLAVRLLERLGHTVTVAINGIDALDKLESHGFDLVLMDIQMPVLDGLEATREQRAREERSGGHVPIVAMTAHAMRGDRERCLRAGMDDYLSKPIRTDELRRILDRHAPAANGNGHPEGGSDPSPPLTEGPSSTPEEAV